MYFHRDRGSRASERPMAATPRLSNNPNQSSLLTVGYNEPRSALVDTCMANAREEWYEGDLVDWFRRD
jgi:hypothetical protein